MEHVRYLYIDADNSTHDVVASDEPPTGRDREMVAANLFVILRVSDSQVDRLQADGRWQPVGEAELVGDPEAPGQWPEEQMWHGQRERGEASDQDPKQVDEPPGWRQQL